VTHAERIALPKEKRITARAALLHLLQDEQWHSWRDCSARAGIRFGARLMELRREGYVIESMDLEVGRAYRLIARTEPVEGRKRGRLLLAESDLKSLAEGEVTPHTRRAAKGALERVAKARGAA
jgi:hypothetical protein